MMSALAKDVDFKDFVKKGTAVFKIKEAEKYSIPALVKRNTLSGIKSDLSTLGKKFFYHIFVYRFTFKQITQSE